MYAPQATNQIVPGNCPATVGESYALGFKQRNSQLILYKLLWQQN